MGAHPSEPSRGRASAVRRRRRRERGEGAPAPQRARDPHACQPCRTGSSSVRCARAPGCRRSRARREREGERAAARRRRPCGVSLRFRVPSVRSRRRLARAWGADARAPLPLRPPRRPADPRCGSLAFLPKKRAKRCKGKGASRAARAAAARARARARARVELEAIWRPGGRGPPAPAPSEALLRVPPPPPPCARCAVGRSLRATTACGGRPGRDRPRAAAVPCTGWCARRGLVRWSGAVAALRSAAAAGAMGMERMPRAPARSPPRAAADAGPRAFTSQSRPSRRMTRPSRPTSPPSWRSRRA